ncbi:MAG TPA: hypothetical protein VK195_10935 [Burkholderiaceae bacterium]|nr:hypothetical protein [Burkholderiaceae bacterium]
MQITPEAPRFQLSHTPEGLQAVIPARRSVLVQLFLLVWLAGWCFGEIQVVEQLLQQQLHPDAKTPTAFLALWLAGWTAGGLGAVGTLVWQFAGRELLTVNAMSLVHRVEMLGLGVTRVYAAASIKALRAAPDGGGSLARQQACMPPFFGPARGALAFDYGSRTIRLAVGLDEAEAKALVPPLAALLPAAARQP